MFGIQRASRFSGSDVFVEEFSRVRVQEETKLWEALGWVPDVQCAWQNLLQCAGLCCHPFLRTVPPAQSATYANSHDAGMWTATETVLGRLTRSVEQKDMARCLATLPMRLGGLGLRSATRMAPAAYWASWADAFPMISALPSLGEEILEVMTGEQAGGCIDELVSAAGQLDRGGFLQRPDWLQLRAGVRPPVALDAEPGEW